MLTACASAPGQLYTHTVSPFSHDFHAVPVGARVCRVHEHSLKEPISRAGISVSFTARVVKEAAQAAGLKNIYYADLETVSILHGVYARRTLILCGD